MEARPARTEDRGLARLTLLGQLGRLYVRLGRIAEGEEQLRRAEALHARLGRPAVPGMVTDPRLALGQIAVIRGDYGAADRLAEAAEPTAAAQGHRHNQRFAWDLRARVAMHLGQLDDARRYAWRARELAEATGDRWTLAYTLNVLGTVALGAGDNAAARAAYESSLAIQEELGDRGGMGVAWNKLGLVALREGDGAAARRAFERSRAVYEEIGDAGGLTDALEGLANAAVSERDHAAARARLRAALGAVSGRAFGVYLPSLLVSVAELAVRAGQGTGDASVEYDPSFYRGLLGFGGTGPSTYPRLNHYWASLSQDRFVNLIGSHVYGWFDIPGPLSVYNNESTNEDLTEAARDCAGAAQSSVVFNDYTHLGLVFNGFVHGASWGGERTLTLDGQTKTWKVVWMTGDMHLSQRPWVHEMGHTFGLPHSSGPYDETYDSQWDPMSRGPCGNKQAVYGCIATYPTSAHMDFLGWIPDTGAKFTALPGQTARVTLQPLREPYVAGSVRRLMAQIPIGASSTRFYTVEYRSSGGYEDGTPFSGVVIHKVDAALSDRNARVVDGDNDGDPNDDGAVWKAGERFVDAANNIAVQVESIAAAPPRS